MKPYSRTPTDCVFGVAGGSHEGGRIKAELRLPWYRSLPVSTVEVEIVEIDGQPVPPELIRFELDGQSYRLSDMEEQTGHVWYVLDSAWLHVEAPGLTAGEHQLAIVLNSYPPYIHGLKRPVRDTCSVLVSPGSPE